MEEVTAIRALPCMCGCKCIHGVADQKRCPCFVARVSKKIVVFTYCKVCKCLTWHVGKQCVKCKQRGR